MRILENQLYTEKNPWNHILIKIGKEDKKQSLKVICFEHKNLAVKGLALKVLLLFPEPFNSKSTSKKSDLNFVILAVYSVKNTTAWLLLV